MPWWMKSRQNINDVMKDPTKFIAADRWMGNLHRNHRCKTKSLWKKIGDTARPKGSTDDDWKKVTEQWTKQIEEERAISRSEGPSSKVNSTYPIFLGISFSNCINF